MTYSFSSVSKSSVEIVLFVVRVVTAQFEDLISVLNLLRLDNDLSVRLLEQVIIRTGLIICHFVSWVAMVTSATLEVFYF